MKTLIKTFKWLGLALLGFVVVVGLCWLLIPDEKLNPEVAKFVAQPAAPPTARNAYFMIWGLPASPELDAHVVGQKIVAAHDRLLAAEKDLATFKVNSFYGENPLQLPKDSKRFCDAEKENCLLVYQAKRAEMDLQAEEKKVYLARYRKIRDYEDFGVAMSQANLQSPIPSWNQILRMSDLVDGAIAVRMQSKGSEKAALEELAAEVNSWRRLLQGNDALVTQMISVATLGRKYRLASEIMNAYPDAVVAYPALMTTITFPLSPAETNILLAMQAETRYQLATIRDMSLRGRFLEDSFFEGMPGPPLRAAFAAGGFRPNATTNDLYLVFKEALDLLTKSPKEIFDGHQAMLARQEKMMGLTSGAIFFNLVGRAVTMRGSPDLPAYAFRVADLIGFSRLIDLQRRIIEGNVAVDKVGAALAVVGPVLMDPYTEKPMQWDATTKRVSFVTRGKRYPMFGYVTLEHFK